jgi:hypothetical protein
MMAGYQIFFPGAIRARATAVITRRRRYTITIKKVGQESARGMDMHVGRSSTAHEAPLRRAATVSKKNWWADGRSMTIVVVLILAIGGSLYLVKGRDVTHDASPARRASSSAASSVNAPPPSSPRRHTAARAGPSASGGGTYNGLAPAGDAHSFLAFSREAKARHGSSTAGPSSAGAPSSSGASSTGDMRPLSAGSPSVLSHGDQNIVLPDKLSGECRVGGANIGEFLKGLGDCFSRRMGGGA